MSGCIQVSERQLTEMKVSCQVVINQVYEGEKATYLTGMDLETGGAFKLSGQFADVPVYPAICSVEGSVEGRLFNNQLTLVAKKIAIKKIGVLKVSE